MADKDGYPSLSGLNRLAYSVNETAKMLGVSPTSVLQWIHSGKLRAIQKGSGRARMHFTIPLAAIQEFLTSGSNR